MKRCLIGNTTFLIFISTMPHSVRTWPKWGTVVQWLSIIMYHVCYVCFFFSKIDSLYNRPFVFSHELFRFFYCGLLWPIMLLWLLSLLKAVWLSITAFIYFIQCMNIDCHTTSAYFSLDLKSNWLNNYRYTSYMVLKRRSLKFTDKTCSFVK